MPPCLLFRGIGLEPDLARIAEHASVFLDLRQAQDRVNAPGWCWEYIRNRRWCKNVVEIAVLGIRMTVAAFRPGLIVTKIRRRTAPLDLGDKRT
jgi:hypothetical protein